MGKLKNNTPGPRVGSTPHPGGKTGNLPNTTSSEGGQLPGPSAGSYSGSRYGGRSSGVSGNIGKPIQNPVLPSGNPHSKGTK